MADKITITAAKTFKVQQADGTERTVHLGEEVPEAVNWPRLDQWVKSGHVTVVGLTGPLSAVIGKNKTPPALRRVPGDKDYGKTAKEIWAAGKRKAKRKSKSKASKTGKKKSKRAPKATPESAADKPTE